MARSKAYVLHPAAWAEIEGGAPLVQEHSGDAAVSFLNTIWRHSSKRGRERAQCVRCVVHGYHVYLVVLRYVLDALEIISQAPQRWPAYLHNTQRFVVQRFPFSIISGLQVLNA